MRLVLRIVVGLVAVVIAAVLGAAAFAEFGGRAKLHRIVKVDVASIAIPTDQAALDRGAYLYKSRGCADCHGLDGAGKVVFDQGGFRVKAPQITPSDTSVTALYKPEDWVRTIRHGVRPNGEPIVVMPSDDYNRLTDADVGAIVAYVGALPVTPGTRAEIDIPLFFRFLYAGGVITDAAEKIDHKLPPTKPFADTDIAAKGAYVAAACQGCHNPVFSGGLIPGAPPDWPPAANLTPGPNGVLSRYPDAAALAAMFRSGKRPDGMAINEAMPFASLREMSSDDIAALHAFLKSLPALKPGEQPARKG